MDIQKALDLSLKDAQQIARRFSIIGGRTAGAAHTAALTLVARLKDLGARDDE